MLHRQARLSQVYPCRAEAHKLCDKRVLCVGSVASPFASPLKPRTWFFSQRVIMAQGHLRLILLPIIYNAMAAKENLRALPLFTALHQAMRASTYDCLLRHPSTQPIPPQQREPRSRQAKSSDASAACQSVGFAEAEPHRSASVHPPCQCTGVIACPEPASACTLHRQADTTGAQLSCMFVRNVLRM